MRSVSWLHTADLHLGKPIEKWKGIKGRIFDTKRGISANVSAHD